MRARTCFRSACRVFTSCARRSDSALAAAAASTAASFSWRNWATHWTARWIRSSRLLRESTSNSRGLMDSSLGLRESRFGGGHQLLESGIVFEGDVRQNLAIQVHAGGLQAVQELAVGKAGGAAGGVDAHDPQRTVVALF